MARPTYYLFRHMFLTNEAYENTKEKYTKMGFRVVTFTDTRSNHNIEEGIKALIKNHIINHEN